MKRRIGLLLVMLLVLFVAMPTQVRAADDPRMTSFRLANVDGVIDTSHHTISVELNASVDLTSLVATFATSKDAKVTVGGKTQISGNTSNDFSKPLEYTVEADDRSVAYTVTVRIVSGETKMLSFRVGGVNATISESKKTITAELPVGASLSSLAPEFTASSGTTVRVGSTKGTIQKSGSTKNNFTKSIVYYVIAPNGNYAKYTVTLKATSSNLAFTKFSVAGYEGVIDAKTRTITVTFPAGTSKTRLIATFETADECEVRFSSRLGNKQVSGDTANDFSGVVKYYLVSPSDDQTYVAYTVRLESKATATTSPTPSSKTSNAVTVTVMPKRIALGSSYIWKPSVSGTIRSLSNRSSNTNIVECRSDGSFYARAEGSATLTTVVSYRSASGKTTSMSVTHKVKVVVPVTAVTLSAKTASIKVGGTATLKATVQPSNATDSDVTWSTSNKSIAKVSEDGVVTGVAKGTCVITGTSLDGAAGKCTVTVK